MSDVFAPAIPVGQQRLQSLSELYQKLYTSCDAVKSQNSRCGNKFIKTAISARSNIFNYTFRFISCRNISKTDIIQTNYFFIFSTSIFFALALSLTINYFTALILEEAVTEHLRHFGYTLIPLILFGFISHYSVDVFGNVKGTLMIFNAYKMNLNFTTTFQLLTVLTGLLITLYLIIRLF